MEVRAAPEHTKSSWQQKAEFLESIAELKDPTKSCKQSPEAFVLEYSAFIERVQRGVGSNLTGGQQNSSCFLSAGLHPRELHGVTLAELVFGVMAKDFPNCP